jgi:hypothetical protein
MIMDTYHTAFWSDPSYSSSDEDEDRYKQGVVAVLMYVGLVQTRLKSAWV